MTENNQKHSERIKNIKRLIINTACKLKQGHIPSSFSSIEILYTLYNCVANITKENAANLKRDRVIISKEHCRLAQLCILTENGLLKSEYLDTYIQDGGILGHDIYNIVSKHKLEAIDVSSGSLGHGASVGIGLAWNNSNNIYVIVGDGELQEGSCWEAILFAGHHRLKNFTLIIDRNYMQIDNYTNNILDSSSNVANRIKSFGFDVFECNGHNISDLEKYLKIKTNKAKCIIANTIKGKELEFVRERIGCALFHWNLLSNDDAEKIIKEIDNV